MVRLSIRPAPTLDGSGDFTKHAEAVRDWTRDAEKSLRQLESAVNVARDAHMATTTDNVTIAATGGVTILDSVAMTATLPSAATVPGRAFTIKLVHTPTNGTSVKVVGVAGQTIDGVTAAGGGYALSAKYKYVTVQSDGSNWHVVAAG